DKALDAPGLPIGPGATMAREIEANDAVIPREISRGDVPVMQVAPQAVSEDDGRSAAFGDMVDGDAVGRRDACLDRSGCVEPHGQRLAPKCCSSLASRDVHPPSCLRPFSSSGTPRWTIVICVPPSRGSNRTETTVSIPCVCWDIHVCSTARGR